jgi:peptide/nickel transport system permease protein
MNLLPGTTAGALLGNTATRQQLRVLTIELGQNKPFFVRYFDWLGHAFQGNFGVSLASNQPVSTILSQRLPVSAELIVLAFVLSIGFAIPVAVLAARRPNGIADRISAIVSMIGFSIPDFVLGLVLILIFAVWLHLLPAISFTPLSGGLLPNLRSMILPSSTIAFVLFARYSRILRADLVDQLVSEDYVVTARAKGLSPWRVLIRHVLRNSMFGLVTLIAVNVGTLLGGTVIVEDIFALPGVGQELFMAISLKDITVVQDIVCLVAAVVVVANLAADLLYAVLDPRIRYGRAGS